VSIGIRYLEAILCRFGELVRRELRRLLLTGGREDDHPRLPLDPLLVEPADPMPERLGAVSPGADRVGELGDADADLTHRNESGV